MLQVPARSKVKISLSMASFPSGRSEHLRASVSDLGSPSALDGGDDERIMANVKNKFLLIVCEKCCRRAPLIIRVEASEYSVIRPLIVAVFVRWLASLVLGFGSCSCGLSG